MIKILGLFCIVCAASCVGFGYAGAIGRRQKQLQSWITALSAMESEIRYRMTPLGELFRQMAQSAEGAVGDCFEKLASGLAENRDAGVYPLMKDALTVHGLCLSQSMRQTLLSLASVMGKMDVEGECRNLSLAADRLSRELQALDADGTKRAANYRTIGVCAGLAIAVILV